MKTEEEIRQYFTQYKFKPNPNHFIIVDKWNNGAFKTYGYEIFDYISKCVDEMVMETCYKNIYNNFADFNKMNIGINNVDKDEYTWDNKFNKWSWIDKFDNGVIFIKGD